MKKCIIFLFSLIVFTILGSSCGGSNDDELRSTVDSFSVAYFNWQFGKAQEYVDKGSDRWLSLIASQVNQEDIDTLKNMPYGAEVEIKELDNNDSTAMATVKVSHFLSMDSIGKSPHIINNATFQIPAKIFSGKWKVVMRGAFRPLR